MAEQEIPVVKDVPFQNKSIKDEIRDAEIYFETANCKKVKCFRVSGTVVYCLENDGYYRYSK